MASGTRSASASAILPDDQADGAGAGVLPTDLLVHTGEDDLGCEHHPLPRDQRHRFRLGGEGVREDLELERLLRDLLHVDGPEAHCLADEAQQRGAVRGFHWDDCVAETAAGGSDLGPVGLVVLGVEVERAVHSRLQGLAELRRLAGHVDGNCVDGVSVQLQPAGLLKAVDELLELSRGDQFLGPGHLLKLFFVFHWGR